MQWHAMRHSDGWSLLMTDQKCFGRWQRPASMSRAQGSNGGAFFVKRCTGFTMLHIHWGGHTVDIAQRCKHGVWNPAALISCCELVDSLRLAVVNTCLLTLGKNIMYFTCVLLHSWVCIWCIWSRSKSSKSTPRPLSTAMCCVMALNLGTDGCSLAQHGTAFWESKECSISRTVVYFSSYLLLTGGSA